MPGQHPDSQMLERFMRNEAGAQERRAVVLHLLTGCAQCVAVTRRLWRLGEEPLKPPRKARRGERPALSDPEATERVWREAMQEAMRAGLAREAARALLELALLYVRQGRAADLQRLAEELRPICYLPGVGMSVTSALLFFRRLVETGFATQDVLSEVALFLGDLPKAQRATWK
ncbi:MAG: hypothetical protein WAM82_21775 [Thermoanaerobaculia bacterium]